MSKATIPSTLVIGDTEVELELEVHYDDWDGVRLTEVYLGGTDILPELDDGAREGIEDQVNQYKSFGITDFKRGIR